MEVCALRDAAPDFGKLGVSVYGISFDDVASQAAFHKAHKLSFPLLSDPDASVGQKFGVMRPKRRGFPMRHSFIIDPEGVLRHVSKKVNVREHGAELVKLIEDLKQD